MLARLAVLVLALGSPAVFAQAAPQASLTPHHTSGTFDPGVKPLPADFPEAPTLGRMTLNKTLHGGIEGTGTGQMLTAMTATKGSAGYVAVEVVTGKVDGRSGSFSLIHTGLMDKGKPTLTIAVIPDSGTGELTGITGTFNVKIAPDGKHSFDFDYTLPA